MEYSPEGKQALIPCLLEHPTSCAESSQGFNHHRIEISRYSILELQHRPMPRHCLRIRLQRQKPLREAFCCRSFRLVPRYKAGKVRRNLLNSMESTSPRRLARPRTSPFHGGNTGSNPVGDANSFQELPSNAPIPHRHKKEQLRAEFCKPASTTASIYGIFRQFVAGTKRNTRLVHQATSAADARSRRITLL
jgi:hypothetical protein